MANTAISDIAAQIQASGGSEEIEPALGDGNAKAGECCYIDPADGKAKGIDGNSATAGLHFAGIMDRHAQVALDTLITTALVCNLLVPKSGRKYNVFIEDFGATAYKGTPLTFGQTTPGSLKGVATKAATGKITPTIALTGDAQDIVNEPVIAYLAKDVANGDTVARVRWA